MNEERTFPHSSLVSRLDRMETKIDNLQETIVLLARVEERQHFQQDWNEHKQIEHEEIFQRLATIERFQWKMAGGLIIISLIVGYFLPALANGLAKIFIGGT